MQDSRDDLTPNQVAALAALLAGSSVRAAAKAARVDPATVHRWLNEPAFRAAQQAGRRELAQQSLAQLQGITEVAIGVVKELMTDKTKPASVRLRAAQIVIEATVKWLELEDMAARLTALEQAYAQKS
jgi:hypothetical protein